MYAKIKPKTCIVFNSTINTQLYLQIHFINCFGNIFRRVPLYTVRETSFFEAVKFVKKKKKKNANMYRISTNSSKFQPGSWFAKSLPEILTSG